MAQGRLQEKKLAVKQSSVKSLIDQIDQATVDIFNTFSVAFAEGSLIAHGSDVDKVGLFKDIWKKLDIKDIPFSSLKELDAYYDGFEKTLDFHISDFLIISRIEDANINEQKKNMLIQITRLYHTLAKHRWLLSQFKDNDTTVSFANDVQGFKTACGFIQNDISISRFSEFKEIFYLLDSLNEVITVNLMAMGYLKSKPITNKLKEISKDELILSVSILLSELPKIEQMNKVIFRLNQSVEAKDKQGIDESRHMINEYIKRLHEIKKQLHQILTHFLKKMTDSFKESCLQRDGLKEKIDKIEQQQDFFRVLNIISDLREKNNLTEAFKQTRDICKQQSQTWITNGPWNVAEQNLEKIFINLDGHCKLSMEGYSKSLIGIHEFLESIKKNYKQREQLEQTCMKLGEKLQNINQLWLTSCDAILHIEHMLDNHLKATEDDKLPTYYSSFFSRHWWKMLIGGVGGGGVGLGIGFLLSLDPFTMAFICIISAFFATTAGAATGFTIDYCCSDKMNLKTDTETIALLSDELELESEANLYQSDEELKHINRLQQVLIADEDRQYNSEFSNSYTTNNGWWPSFSLWGNVNQTSGEKDIRKEIALKPFV